MTGRPSAVFVRVHNAGLSQMAAGFATALSAGVAEVRSAGSVPAERVDPVAVAAMAEVGGDWDLPDPAGRGIEAVRPIRDEVRRRVEALLADLVPSRG